MQIVVERCRIHHCIDLCINLQEFLSITNCCIELLISHLLVLIRLQLKAAETYCMHEDIEDIVKR